MVTRKANAITKKRPNPAPKADVQVQQVTDPELDVRFWRSRRVAIATELAKVLLGRVSLSDAESLEKLPTLAVRTADRLMIANFNMPGPTFETKPADGEKL